MSGPAIDLAGQLRDALLAATCPWCRTCGSCDSGLAMSCTCGDCDCPEDCGHPNCEAAGWAAREKRTIPSTFQGVQS